LGLSRLASEFDGGLSLQSRIGSKKILGVFLRSHLRSLALVYAVHVLYYQIIYFLCKDSPYQYALDVAYRFPDQDSLKIGSVRPNTLLVDSAPANRPTNSKNAPKKALEVPLRMEDMRNQHRDLIKR
jgi:hypothetical protein